MKYLVNFGTGVGNEYADTVEKAKEIAEEKATFTQASITIELVNDDDEEVTEVVAELLWSSMRATDEDEVTIDFGDLGFYGEWIDF